MTTPPLACVVSEERMPDREWVRLERRAGNPERGRGVKIGFLNADGTKESGVVQCSWIENLQHSIEEP